jgi:hypothetical protein
MLMVLEKPLMAMGEPNGGHPRIDHDRIIAHVPEVRSENTASLLTPHPSSLRVARLHPLGKVTLYRFGKAKR